MSEMYKQGNSLGFRFGSAIAFSTAPPTHRRGLTIINISLCVRFSNKGKGLGLVEWTWGKRLGLDCRRRLLFPEEAERAESGD